MTEQLENEMKCKSKLLEIEMSEEDDSSSIGVNFRITGQKCKGGRKYMEDFFSIKSLPKENSDEMEYAFIGIYDGHGGHEAAKFAQENLMKEIVKQKLFWSNSDLDVLNAIREGYIATHFAMWREQQKWPKTSHGFPSTAGTTATVAFIRCGKLYIGHVGDSGIVLGYQNENENFWRSKQLTIDHKPDTPAERERIIQSGGKIISKCDVCRVVWFRPCFIGHLCPPVLEIPFLAVARSLGDLWSFNSERNEFVVSPIPDLRVININSKTFRCLIFGSDGLWNALSAADAVNIVQKQDYINTILKPANGALPHKNNLWADPSKRLLEKALEDWSTKKRRPADNIAVVTVMFGPIIDDADDQCSNEMNQMESTKFANK